MNFSAKYVPDPQIVPYCLKKYAKDNVERSTRTKRYGQVYKAGKQDRVHDKTSSVYPDKKLELTKRIGLAWHNASQSQIYMNYVS